MVTRGIEPRKNIEEWKRVDAIAVVLDSNLFTRNHNVLVDICVSIRKDWASSL